MAWELVGVSNTVEVTGTAHALVTTGISGLQEGDLLIACISSRIASTTPMTLPSGWALVGQQNNNSIAQTTSAQATATMAYIVRGASDPALTFTHPTAPSVALGRIIAYRGGNTLVPGNVVGSATSGTNVTAINVAAGVTTTSENELLVVLRAGGQESTISGLAAATSPTTASGATDTSSAPAVDAWTERSDAITTTGADTALSIFDAVKSVPGATGNITATASAGSGHSLVTGAFRIAPFMYPVTITGVDPVKLKVGPFKATNGAFYFFGSDGTTATTLQAYKSTAPQTSWASIATKTGFDTLIRYISAYQDGNVFHFAIADGNGLSNVTIKYLTFDASSDTFVTGPETVVGPHDPGSSTNDRTDTGILIRQNGEIVVVYNQDFGIASAERMAFKRRTGVNTWSTATAHTVTGNQFKARRGTTNIFHVIYNTGSTNYSHVSVSAANAWGSATGSQTGIPVDLLSYDDGGTIRCVGTAATLAMIWNSAHNPTVTSGIAVSGSLQRLAFDNGIVWSLSVSSTTDDLQIKSSSDDGATWGANAAIYPAAIDTGNTEALSHDQTIYTRGGSYVFPVLYDDNGTLKYFEYAVRGGAPVDYVDTIEPSALPIGGGTLADAFGRKDTITPAALPIGGQALADVFGRKDTITAGALPIGGQAIVDRYGRSSTIGASAIPIDGQDIAAVYETGQTDYTDTIEPSAVPVTGQDVAPTYTANYADTLEPGALPIGGATLTPVFAISEAAITAGALPITGATLAPQLAFSDTLTAGALPINGAVLSDLLRFSDTITASEVPITGQNVTPIFSAGGINYGDTIEPSAVPITGQSITAVHVAHYTDTITPGAVPIGGAALADTYARTVTLTAGTLPIAGLALTDAYGRTDVITAGAIPIGGAVLADAFGRTDVIVAGSIPITGQTITAVYTARFSDTITASAVPITGQTISPTHTRIFSDTITAGAVPITGAAIVPFYTARYSDDIIPGELPLVGQVIVPDTTVGINYTDTIEPSSVPIEGMTIEPIYMRIGTAQPGELRFGRTVILRGW